MTDLKNYVCENQMDLFSVIEEMDKYTTSDAMLVIAGTFQEEQQLEKKINGLPCLDAECLKRTGGKCTKKRNRTFERTYWFVTDTEERD